MQKSNKIPSSAIVYRGPSQLDGKTPIVGIVTGINGGSDNPKTGAMAQLWIIRSDIDPVAAVAKGKDGAICGDCPLRGNGRGQERGCYVAVKNAPLAVYHALKRRRYGRRNAGDVAGELREKGIPIRLGAYGEPTALPAELLRELTAGVDHTGYTHQWRSKGEYRDLLMASVDSPAEQRTAAGEGWRTFRTRAGEQGLGQGEIACPASEEGGKRTTCSDCGLCDGMQGDGDRRRHIAIIAHGTTTVHALTVIRARSTAVAA
jgi:hypothetical protein